MSDVVLQELIVRMASDPDFAAKVQGDESVLATFDLTSEERAQLVGLAGDEASGAVGLEERQSKSSIFPAC